MPPLRPPPLRSAVAVLAWLAVASPSGADQPREASGTGGSGSAPAVFVPNLWNFASPPPKPDPDALTPLLVIVGENDPPFEFTLPDGTLAGFNVDLARAICEELKVSCTVQSRRWETITPAIEAGAGDAAVASVAISDTALRDLDFSSPYYRTPARFVAPLADGIAAVLPETVGGKRIGVEAGSAHEAYLKAFFAAATIVPFPSSGELRAAIEARKVDLAFGDGIGFAGWLNGPEGAACCAFAGGPFTESHFFGEGAGIAVRKGRTGLRRAIDYALWRLAQSGAYADLWLKYFPVSPY